MEDNQIRITLRIPADLHKRLQRSADIASHSMNAEIITRLELSYQETARTEQIEAIADLIASKVALKIKRV